MLINEIISNNELHIQNKLQNISIFNRILFPYTFKNDQEEIID